MNMHIARPACADDVPALATLQGARSAGTLPQHEDELLLVAEDLGSAQIVAAVRLRPAIGLTQPRWWYHVGCTVHAAPELQLFHRQRTLLLGNDLTGASELADLAWRDDPLPLAEQAAALRLVVDAALLAAARRRERYATQVVAELPGLRDVGGQWPFWQGLGRHFYSGDPHDAEARHGEAWRSHVAALLPRHPVIAGFLPASAQAAVAQVAPAARVLRELLEARGLRYGHHVRIDDGGPVLEGELDALPAVAQARLWTVGDDASGGPTQLVMSASGRALHCPASGEDGHLRLPLQARELLGVVAGDAVWATPR